MKEYTKDCGCIVDVALCLRYIHTGQEPSGVTMCAHHQKEHDELMRQAWSMGQAFGDVVVKAYLDSVSK